MSYSSSRPKGVAQSKRKSNSTKVSPVGDEVSKQISGPTPKGASAAAEQGTPASHASASSGLIETGSDLQQPFVEGAVKGDTSIMSEVNVDAKVSDLVVTDDGELGPVDAPLLHEALFSKIGRMRDADLPLFDAAVWVAQEEFKDASVEDARAAINQLAAEVRPHLHGSLAERYGKLGDALFDHIGFRGNREDYYDPFNSYLPKVIKRRLGIPLTLALVVIEVARECGLRAVGVGFPGHFLVRHDGQEEILLDPFTGVLLTREELVKKVADPAIDEDSVGPLLTQTSNLAALVRLVSNLKHAYMLRSDFRRALRSCQIILALDPLNAASYRDRGLVFEKLELFRKAENDLARYLELSPRDRFASAVEDHLAGLRTKLSLFH